MKAHFRISQWKNTVTILCLLLLCLLFINSNPVFSTDAIINIFREEGIAEFVVSDQIEKESKYVQAEICIADGCLAMTNLIPILSDTLDITVPVIGGNGNPPFKAGIYSGRLLFYSDEFTLTEKVSPVSVILYTGDSNQVKYNINNIDKNARLNKPPYFYEISLDTIKMELTTGIYAFPVKNENSIIKVFVLIDSEQILLTEIHNVEPGSIYMNLYADPDAVKLMIAAGDTIYPASVEYYTDEHVLYHKVDAKVNMR